VNEAKLQQLLLYLLVSAGAVIGQFSGPYSPVRAAKIKVRFAAKLFCDLSPLTFFVIYRS